MPRLTECIRRLAGFLVALTLAACSAGDKSSSGDAPAMREVRMAVRGDEADATVAARWDAYKRAIERATLLPVKIFEASDYNGLIQALAAGQVDVAQYGANSYANTYAQVGDKVVPLLAVREAEGGMGYYAAMLVRADSPYQSIADLKGKSLGFVDLNSTSGYLLPRQTMRAQGMDPDTYFGKVGFAGGHPQAVMALMNGQFDAVITQVSGGDPETGFSTGAHFSLARRGLVDLAKLRIIWTAGPMPNSPIVMRADRPAGITDAIRGAIAALPYDEPDTWIEIGQTPGSVPAAVNHEVYAGVVKMREDEIAQRRNGGQ